MHILGKTLGSRVLESGVPIALGTDSPLSGEGDLLDEIRLAHGIARVSPERLYTMVTSVAASILRLRNGEGAITAGGIADLVAVIEADGRVRPCFFHEPIGNIRGQPLSEAINGKAGVDFRSSLDVASNPVCRNCVCSLFLTPDDHRLP